MEGFEEKRSILAAHFWRVDTGAYERDAKTCSLELYLSVHVIKRVVSTVTRDRVKMFSVDGAVELWLEATFTRRLS